MKLEYLIFFALPLFLIACKKDREAVVKENVSEVVEPIPVLEYGFNLNNYKVINDTIKNGESFGVIMDRHRVPYSKINEIATKIKDTFDVRRIRAGKPYVILTSKDSLENAQIFIYKHNKINATVINFKDSLVNAYTFKEPIKVLNQKVAGRITSSLSQTMDDLGLRATLTNKIANDIYAWTLDFKKLQKNDAFKIIFEEKFIEDTVSVGYGKIKALLFNHKGKDLYAYRYVIDSVKNIPEYYNEKAEVLRRQFLKSPIKFQYRISSRYNLKRRIKLYGNKVRPHKGTDFAAKYGTPIMVTASGVVTESRRRGGNGNYVKVKHNDTYSTQYLHMKRRKVKKGDYVKQGDIIGWVGMTGNTSGPHVCYRFWKNGRQVDPFKQKLPSAKPMKDSLKPRYLKFIEPLKQQLDSINFPKIELTKAKEIVVKTNYDLTKYQSDKNRNLGRVN